MIIKKLRTAEDQLFEELLEKETSRTIFEALLSKIFECGWILLKEDAFFEREKRLEDLEKEIKNKDEQIENWKNKYKEKVFAND